MNRTRRAAGLLPGLIALCCLLVPLATAWAQPELSYDDYRTLARAANRFDHVTQFEPVAGGTGMFFAVGERFGTVQVYRMTGQGVQREWKSSHLSGVPEEVLVVDLDGDGFDDSLLCRTNVGKMYVWKLEDFSQSWESLTGEYRVVTCFTTGNTDEGPEAEIILLGDGKIVYVDGVTFAREFVSIAEYDATNMRCGDVDGDGRAEIVLNSGQVVDSATGEVEWDEEKFLARVELLDIDGDGIPEILTENDLGGALKVFNASYRSEVRFQ